MNKREHKVEILSKGILFLPQFGVGNTLEEQEQKLNKSGEEGWKLVEVRPRRMFFIFTQMVAYYTRETKEAAVILPKVEKTEEKK